MKRFVEGGDRRQATLLPDSLEDYVTEDNPVRVVDVFIDELDLEALGFSGCCAGGDRSARLSSCDASRRSTSLRLSQSHPVEPAARLGEPTQHRADVAADRPTDAGLQDDRRLPPRQRAGDPRGVRAVRRAVPSVQPFSRGLSLRSTGASSRRSTIATTKNFTVAKVAKRIEQVEASIAALPGGLGPCRPGRTAIWPRPRQPRLKGEDHRGPAAADAVPQGDWQAG